MQDEEAFLTTKIRDVQETDPSLAYQLGLYYEEQTRSLQRTLNLAAPLFQALLCPMDKSLIIPGNTMELKEDDGGIDEGKEKEKEEEKKEEKEEEEKEEEEKEKEEKEEEEKEEEEKEEEEDGVGILAEALDTFVIAF
ncbi:hypothetical protein H0H92_000319 [Tricholoma furcatifolium]|nr:hypothetical protein H0H92_000319 [Tricholoma furcatifolium]